VVLELLALVGGALVGGVIALGQRRRRLPRSAFIVVSIVYSAIQTLAWLGPWDYPILRWGVLGCLVGLLSIVIKRPWEGRT
jgi:hypothetical protein